MKILITGATGFIGSHVTCAMLAARHEVIACVRNPDAAKKRWPYITAIPVDFSHSQYAADWLPHLKNVDIVINAVGIIRETRRQSFEALHTRAPIALFNACKEAGVKMVIQISALGADESAFSQYHLSKRAADEHLTSLDINWVIAMPSIVYGDGAKSIAFFKAMVALPVVPLVGDGDQPVQPIHIDDFIRAIMQIINTGRPARVKIPMVGPRPIIMKEIYSMLRAWLGLGRPYFIRIPYTLALIAGELAGFLGNTPMTAEAIKMLRNGNTGNVSVFTRYFDFTPTGFDEVFARIPAQQSDRWYAGLYFIRPLLRNAIAIVWMAAGIVSVFVYPAEQSYVLLAGAGISGTWAALALYGAAALDFALGMATVLAYRLTAIGYLQITLMLFYTLIITLSLPEQWAHPFGPITKNLPFIVATLIMIALERR